MLLTKIQEAAALYPENTAVIFKSGDAYQKYSYRDLVKAIASVASGFVRHGIRKGDRVALFSENRPEWVFAYLGAVSIGAVVVPIDAQLTETELSVLLKDSEVTAVCISDTTRAKLPPSGSYLLISFDAGEGLSFSKLISENPNASIPPPPDAADLAAILYTSGTTGDPKGVMLTHGNLAANCSSLIRLDLIEPSDNVLCILPLHHTYPAMVCMILPLSVGATMTILNSLKGPDIIACMQETGVTILIGVPQLFAGLRRAIFEQINAKPAPVRFIAKLLIGLNRLLIKIAGVNIGRSLFGQVHARFGPKFRLFASGGARLDPDVHRDMMGLGFIIIEGYGLTETSPVCTFNPLSKQKPGSIGIPIPGVDVQIAEPDEAGMGEIAVRGPNVMAGYYKKPEETAKVLRDGWFYTGDLGYRDKEGYFFITGRSKEMIALSTGKKIFPDEIEAFYKHIPAIKEICVVETERGIEAAVVPDFDYLRKMNISNSREAIASDIEDMSRSLPAYKRVMGLKIFKDSLPVTRLGKLKRALIRQMYLGAAVQPAKPEAQEKGAGILSDDLGKRLLTCLEPFTSKRPILADDNIELDLGLDSLARVELLVSLERSFGIRLPDSFGSEIFTVREAADRIRDLLNRREPQDGTSVRMSWADILRQEPDPAAARELILDAGVFCNAGKYSMRALLKLFYLLFGRMSVTGVENLPLHGPYIIAPNHLSYADAPLLVSAMPWTIGVDTFFLGHTKYFGGPLTSRIAKLINVIPVDMEARLHNALQLSAFVLRRGKILCVFPEGTRSRDGELKEFKKGVGILAKEMNVPIVPVAISGTFAMLPPGSSLPRPARVSVSFGMPIHPDALEYDEIVQRLRSDVAEMLGGDSR